MAVPSFEGSLAVFESMKKKTRIFYSSRNKKSDEQVKCAHAPICNINPWIGRQN